VLRVTLWLIVFCVGFVSMLSCGTQKSPPPEAERRRDERRHEISEVTRREAEAFIAQAFKSLSGRDSVAAERDLRASIPKLCAAERFTESAVVAIVTAAMARDRADFSQARTDLQLVPKLLENEEAVNARDLHPPQISQMLNTLLQNVGLTMDAVGGDLRLDNLLNLIAASTLAEISFAEGNYDEVEATLEKIESRLRIIPGTLRSRSKILLSRAARKQGRVDDARHDLLQALDAMGGPECHRDTGETLLLCVLALNDLGDLEHSDSNDEAALGWNDRALAAARRLGAPFNELEVLSSRCLMLPQVGAETAKRSLVASGEDLVDKLNDPMTRARGLLQLATLASCSDDYERVLSASLTVMEILRDYPNHELSTAAKALETLARSRLGYEPSSSTIRPSPGETKREGILREAAEKERALAEGINTPDAALEKLLILSGASASARARIWQAVEDVGAAGTVEERKRYTDQLLRVLRKERVLDEAETVAFVRALGGPVEAVREALKAIRLSEGAALPGRKSTEEFLSNTILGLGDSTSAFSLAQEWIEIEEISSQHSRNAELDLGRSKRAAKAYETLLLLTLRDERKGRAEVAFRLTERARSFALMRWLGYAKPIPRDGASQRLITDLDTAKAEIRRLEASQPAWVVEQQEQEVQIRKARGRYNDLLLRLKLTQPGYSELAASVTANLDQARAALPPATTLLSYFTLPDRTLAWVIEKDRWKMVELPTTRAELASRIANYRRYVASARPERGERGFEKIGLKRDERQQEQGRELFDLLIAPLEPHIHHQRLLVVPHDALHELPFAALYDSSTKRYLSQEFSLSYLPSASALLVWTGVPESRSAPPLVIGDPMTRVPGLRPLPAARKEAAEVARILGTSALVGDNARESTVREKAESLPLLHLASHGVRMARERESFLALAADALAADRLQDGQDGRLEMGEVFDELRFRNHPLVVLSACESGLGQPGGNDEVEGMVRAFLYAGAGSVMATLWPIADEASALLTEKFYQQLAAGQSAAEALRKAQESMITDPKYGDPYFWAGFTLTGDPRTRLIRSR
jgi:CHAT domain-containing protein